MIFKNNEEYEQEIVWHQNASQDSDELLDVFGGAVLAPGNRDTLADRQWIRLDDEVLVAEGDGHHGDQETEEQLQPSQAVFVEEQEGEGIKNCNQNARPNWQVPIGQHVQSDGGSCELRKRSNVQLDFEPKFSIHPEEFI